MILLAALHDRILQVNLGPKCRLGLGLSKLDIETMDIWIQMVENLTKSFLVAFYEHPLAQEWRQATCEPLGGFSWTTTYSVQQ